MADSLVHGHVRKDGTYVAPHYRSKPDSTAINNYSTSPNVNPYTGKTGTVNQYKAAGQPLKARSSKHHALYP